MYNFWSFSNDFLNTFDGRNELEIAVLIVSWHDATVCLRDTWHSAGPCDVTVMGDAGRVIECHPNWDQIHTTRRPPFCHQHWEVALKSYSLKLKINYLWYDFPFPLTIVAVIMACVAVTGHRHATETCKRCLTLLKGSFKNTNFVWRQLA